MGFASAQPILRSPQPSRLRNVVDSRHRLVGLFFRPDILDRGPADDLAGGYLKPEGPQHFGIVRTQADLGRMPVRLAQAKGAELLLLAAKNARLQDARVDR